MMFWMGMGVLAAEAQTVPLAFSADQHVYSWPAGWLPPGMSPESLERIEQEARSQHVPFYVILLEGSSLPGTGPGQDRLQATTDALMSSWGGQGLDLGTYAVFSVAWGADCDKPRTDQRAGTVCEYFLNVGSDWIHGPAQFLPSRDHAPYTNRFREAVETTPQNPAGGILSLMAAVDALLWERTHPQARLRAAQESLRQAIEERERLLPLAAVPDPARHRFALAEARRVLQRSQPEEMRRQTASLTGENLVLADQLAQVQGMKRALDPQLRDLQEAIRQGWTTAAAQAALLEAAHHAQARGDLAAMRAVLPSLREANLAVDRARRGAWLWRLVGLMGVTGVGLVLLGGGAGVGLRRERVLYARRRYAEQRRILSEKLDHAAANYTHLELDDRAFITAVADTQGETRAESQSISAELDGIYTGIRAIEDHLRRLDGRVAAAGPLSTAVIVSACRDLQGAMPDATQAPTQPAPLFAAEGPTPQVRIDDFMAALEARFAGVQARRQRLLQAASLRFQASWSTSGHDTLTALLGRLSARGLSHQWVADHPLAGDDEADALWYASLDLLRRDDPLAYLGTLEQFQAQEARIVQRVELLEAALEALQTSHMDTLPDMHDIIVDVSDDPRHTFRQALAREAEIQSQLALQAQHQEPSAVLQMIDEVCRLWRYGRQQLDEIQRATRDIEHTGQKVAARVPEILRDIEQTQSHLSTFKDTFSQVPGELERLAKASAALKSVVRLQQQADARRQARRVLDAWRMLQEAQDLTAQAAVQAQSVRERLDTLQEEQAEYQRQLARMDALHDHAVEQMRHAGGDVRALSPFQAPALSGPVDYNAQRHALLVVVDAWQAQVHTAQYSLEQRYRHQRRGAPVTILHSLPPSAAAAASRVGGTNGGGGAGRLGSSGGGGGVEAKRSSGGGGGFSVRRSSGGGRRRR